MTLDTRITPNRNLIRNYFQWFADRRLQKRRRYSRIYFPLICNFTGKQIGNTLNRHLKVRQIRMTTQSAWIATLMLYLSTEPRRAKSCQLTAKLIQGSIRTSSILFWRPQKTWTLEHLTSNYLEIIAVTGLLAIFLCDYPRRIAPALTLRNRPPNENPVDQSRMY